MADPIIPDPNAPEINNPGDENFVHDTPDEIKEWMAQEGIKDKKFTVSIRKYPLEGGSDGVYMPYMQKDKAPDMFDIGKWYGPGKYVVGFSFHVPSEQPGGKPKLTRKDHVIILGEEFQDIHNRHMMEQWAKEEKNAELIAQRMKIKKAYQGGNEGGSEMDNLMKAMQNLKALGVPIGGSGTPATTDNNMFQMLIANMQQSNENIMKIMMSNQNNMMQLFTAMMGNNNNKNQNPEAMFREVSSLIMGAMNLKETLTPERRSALDKIIDMAGELVPTIVEISQKKGLEAAKNDPVVKMAKGMPQFQDIKNNQVDLEYMIKTMDAKQGPDQTDILLATLGLQRTPATARSESKPAETKEEGEAEEVEVIDMPE